MEIWACCPQCVRWFYCGRDKARAHSGPWDCPVCCSSAREVVVTDQDAPLPDRR